MTDNRSFGLIIGAALCVVAAWRFAAVGASPVVLLAVAAIVAAIAWLAPASLAPARRVWMRLATMLGGINARIMLTLVYVFVVTPTAWALRVCGRRPMAIHPDRRVRSYWRMRRSEEFTAARLERQF